MKDLLSTYHFLQNSHLNLLNIFVGKIPSESSEEEISIFRVLSQTTLSENSFLISFVDLSVSLDVSNNFQLPFHHQIHVATFVSLQQVHLTALLS